MMSGCDVLLEHEAGCGMRIGTMVRRAHRWLLVALPLLGMGIWQSAPAVEPLIGEPPGLAELKVTWAQTKEREARPIKEGYLGALEKLQTQLTRDQQLKDAVAVRNEIEALTGVAPHALSERTGPSRLDSLRGIYHGEIRKIAARNNAKYLKGLGVLQNRLTKEGNLEAALVVKAERTRYEELLRSGIAAVELELVAGRGVVDELNVGAKRLTGRYQPVFKKVDAKLLGCQFLRSPWQGKSRVNVRVTHGGTLFACTGNPAALETTGLEWKESEALVAGPYIKKVYETKLMEGQRFEYENFEALLIAKEMKLVQE